MTLTLIEDSLSEEEQLAQQRNPTFKCSWCGEIICMNGDELVLAMCQACYERMLAEYVRMQQGDQPDRHASDR